MSGAAVLGVVTTVAGFCVVLTGIAQPIWLPRRGGIGLALGMAGILVVCVGMAVFVVAYRSAS